MCCARDFYVDNILVNEIVIPDTVTEIKKYAFYSFESITSVTIPDSVTSIGSSSFNKCTSLVSIEIGTAITSINESAFYNTAYYNDSTNWINGVLYINNYLIDVKGTISGTYTIKTETKVIADYAFSSCESLTSVTIPDSVTRIGGGAFSNCTSLTSVMIGNGVTTIGNYAFSSCKSLTSIIVDEENECYSNDEYGVLYNKDKIELIQYPIGNSRTTFEIPDSVTDIGGHVFDACTSLISVTIPDSVTSIGSSAFRGCTSLTSVTIPDLVTSIGNSAFNNCTSLTSVTIPDSVTSIGENVFGFCKSLTSIAIPDTITSIGDWAFQYCENLISITIPDSVTSIGDYAFQDCTKLTTIKMGSVTSIGSYAFYNCTSLTSITIPDSVTSISNDAFSWCSSLISVTIGNKVTSIGNDVFCDCTNLTYIYYNGTAEKWSEISIGSINYDLLHNTVYFLDCSCEYEYFSETTKESTCLNTGEITHTCSFCGNYYVEIVPLVDHTWGNWIVTLEPTTTSTGLRVRYCKTCKTVYQEQMIPELEECSLSGTVTSFDSETYEILITITKKGETKPTYSQTITGRSAEYMFEHIETGYYVVAFSKKNHVTRNYNIAIGNIDETLDIKLHLLGDTIGDGKVNTLDVACANAHAKGMSTLSGYDLACVDVNGDGKVNTVDVAKMNAHAKGVTTLW